ncbi:MAG: FAD-binding protein [Planctomycetota bacterium]
MAGMHERVAEVERRLGEAGVACRRDEALGDKTWFGVGGAAALWVEPGDEAELAATVRACAAAGCPWWVMGSGANLLVRDAGVDGVVIGLTGAGWRAVAGLDGEAGAGGEVEVRAGAGADLMKLVLETARAGLEGLEGVAGVPATVGGAVRMNAGGAYGEVGSAVRRVRVMYADGEAGWLGRESLRFTYRKGDVGAPLIVEVAFGLGRGDAGELVRRVKEVFAYKKASQPMGESSAGCAFRNPVEADGVPEEVKGWGAGKLIDRAGLKGLRVGCASVSEVHANFIAVDKEARGEGGGKADDVVALMGRVAEAVEGRFGVRLVREVVVWGGEG